MTFVGNLAVIRRAHDGDQLGGPAGCVPSTGQGRRSGAPSHVAAQQNGTPEWGLAVR